MLNEFWDLVRHLRFFWMPSVQQKVNILKKQDDKTLKCVFSIL